MTHGPEPNTDREDLDLLLRGFQVSRMLRLVADCEVADNVPADGAISIQDLATTCSVLADPLRRVLQALAAFQIFRIESDGAIAHTARSRLLRTDTPNSMHHAARFWTGRGSWGAWGMLDAAMTGGVPHQAAWKTDRFAYLREHPEEARIFDAMMGNIPNGRHAALAASYDFSGAALIVDIGGGGGAGLRHILARFPAVRGLLFDREDVVEALTAEDLMEGRIERQSGSFFRQVPAGGDIYMLVRVLHDWPDEDCVAILRACRAAMGPRSRLLLGEQIVEPGSAGGQAGSLIDAHMMAMFGRARERSEGEFRGLLQKCGFSLCRVIGTGSSISIIEAALSQ